MRLRLEELQKVVKRAVNEERAADALRAEVNRVLGPAVIAEGRIEIVAEAANDRIDVLERTGRASRLAFRPGVTTRFLDHTNPEVRKFAARVVPEKFLGRLVNDRSSVVRAAVARRIPLNSVSEMLKKFPHDDEVRHIYKQRKLSEGGLPKPKVQDEPFDMYGEDRLGDAVKQDEGAELSEQWYRSCAMRFMNDYGRNIEYTWEEVTARRYAASVKATSGVEIDEAKLLKAIKELIKEREDRALERSALKETLSFLRRQEDRELMSESAMPIIEEQEDPVRDLLESSLTPSTYVERANSVFRVQEATIPAGIRKYRLGELNARVSTVPVIGFLPHKRGFRAIDERALDAYCTNWNDRQAVQGEPLRLEWSNHPDDANKISFTVVLR
jgi:hypothetical protein